MPRGSLPIEYLNTATLNKPIGEIYSEIDAATGEIFAGETECEDQVDFSVILPPLQYEGKRLKGIFFSQGVDLLYDRFPQLSELFFSIATTTRGAYPASTHADAYFTLYRNPHRDDWLRKNHPERANKILLPFQDADYVNEYSYAPLPVEEPEIDVLCVAGLEDVSNLPMIAWALKIHRQRFPESNIRVTLATPKEYQLNLKDMSEDELRVFRTLEEILIHPSEYLHFVTRPSDDEMAKLYSRAKLCLVASLNEGKSQVLHQAMSCNVPVIAFQAHNQHIRGDSLFIPVDAGLVVPQFHPDVLANYIELMLRNRGVFRPRKRYLESTGRKRVFNSCIDRIPYYSSELSGFLYGQHHRNMWLDLAIQDNYQLGLIDFLYDKNTEISRKRGLADIDTMLTFYFERSGVERGDGVAAENAA